MTYSREYAAGQMRLFHQERGDVRPGGELSDERHRARCYPAPGGPPFHDSHEITQVRTHVRRNTGQHDRLSNHDKQCHRRRNGESETPADEAAEELSRRQPYHRPAPPR